MRVLWLVLVLGSAVAACVESTEVRCSDGRTCAAGTQCDLAHDRCISAGQLVACADLAEGDTCTVVGAPGTCRDRVCELSICGDGIRNASESCEGADLGGATCLDFGFTHADGLTCTDSCKYDTSACTGACGDGIKDDAELCDGTALGGADCASVGFYYSSGLACSPFCTYDVTQCRGRCGDGMLDAQFEICDGAAPAGTCVDFGFDAGPISCSLSCGQSFQDCARFGWPREVIDDRSEWTDVSGDWAVGASNGDVAHFNGSTWSVMSTSAGMALVAVAAASANDAWAVGKVGTILHYTGAWTAVTPPDASADYVAVWVAPAGNLFVASASAVWQRTGATWTELSGLSTTSLTSLGGSSANDVWATCADGNIWHWNGSWSTPYTDNAIAFTDLVVIGSEAWFAGYDTSKIGVRVHWSAGAFASETTSTYAEVAPSVIAVSSSNVWMSVGYQLFHFDGVIWRSLQLAASVTSLSALGVNSAVAVAPEGAFRFTGQAFMFPSDDIGGTTGGLLINPPNDTMWAADGIILAFDGTDVARHDGQAWTHTTFPNGLTAVWGTASDDAWLGDSTGLAHHWDGAGWADSALVPQPGPISALGGSGSSDVWAATSDASDQTPTTYHFDGTGWTRHDLASTEPLFAIGSTAANNAWAVSSSFVWHWDGASWTTVSGVPATQFYGLAVVGANNVIVVVAHQALHYDGTSWKTLGLPVDTTDGFVHFTAFAPDDVFAATSAKLAHFDGTRWSPVRLQPNFGGTVIGISGSRRGLDVLFVGETCTRFCFNTREVQTLIRTRPWVCRAKETACADSVDDDCDGSADSTDPDCL